MLQRIREAWMDDDDDDDKFDGPVEVDETYVGGKRDNMSNEQRKALREAGVGRGTVGKTAVVGVKDRDSNEVRAEVVQSVDKKTLHRFIAEHTENDAIVYTDDAQAYDRLPFEHEAVNHSVAEYVRGMAHTNGVESFWSMLNAPTRERFTSCLPMRESGTLAQMRDTVARMVGRRLLYRDLIRDNGLPSTARR